MATEKKEPLRAHDLVGMLRKRYPPDQGYVLVEEVGDGTGANVRRHADAVALQTWPSKGISLDGFEVKISRHDLARELREEGKAEAVARYCRRWWLVVSDEGITTGLAIPEGWGILAPKKAGILHEVKRAAPREPKEWRDDFIAGLVRKAFEQRPSEAERQAHERRIYDEARQSADAGIAREREAAAKILAAVRAFDHGWHGWPRLEGADEKAALRLGQAVALARTAHAGGTRERIEGLANQLEAQARELREAIASAERLEAIERESAERARAAAAAAPVTT